MVVDTMGKTIPPEEVQEYIKYIQKKNPNRKIEKISINVDGDYVDLSWELLEVPFERVRRITGYLVGDMSRWNDGKRAEEADRVKHGLKEAT